MDELDDLMDEKIANASEQWRQMESRLSGEELQHPEIREASRKFWQFIDEAKQKAAHLRFKYMA